MIFILLKTYSQNENRVRSAFLKCRWLSHTSVLREAEGMGRLNIGAVEKAVFGGHDRLEVSGQVSHKFVIIGYIPTVYTTFRGFFSYVIIILPKTC